MNHNFSAGAFTVSDLQARMALSCLWQVRLYSMGIGDVLMLEALMDSASEIAGSIHVTATTKAECDALRATIAIDISLLADETFCVSTVAY